MEMNAWTVHANAGAISTAVTATSAAPAAPSPRAPVLDRLVRLMATSETFTPLGAGDPALEQLVDCSRATILAIRHPGSSVSQTGLKKG